MTYRISEQASRDLSQIYDYISKNKPEAAASAIVKRLENFQRLTVYPKLGHAGRRPGTREFVQVLFLIVYSVGDDVMKIHTVVLSSRHNI